MSAFTIDTELVGGKRLFKRIESMNQDVQDFGPMFNTFSQNFYEQEKKQFKGRGVGDEGQWRENTPDYETWKAKKYGPGLPQMFMAGKLWPSLTTPVGPASVHIVTHNALWIGLDPNSLQYDYAMQHQHGLGPAYQRNGRQYSPRPVIDLTAAWLEQTTNQIWDDFIIDRRAKLTSQ